LYPFLRLFKEMMVHRNGPALPLWGTHVSYHVCWPWDIDPWRELNNGRTLTLYDLGRLPAAARAGLVAVLRQKRWGMTMAGVSVRYRRRVRLFDKIEMRTRFVGWDARFLYVEQSMWKADECTSHALYRVAVTDANGIVAPARVLAAMGEDTIPPEMPGWVAAWIAAEAERPWPPQR
jgi:acyl-CoA thioesterase FadM